MSLVSERDGFFGWRQVDDPYSLEERGWVEDVGSTGSYYPLPRWLVYMCMGGWNEPIRGWTGGLYEKHCYCRSAYHRDGWDGVVLDSEPLYYDEFADGGRYRFRSVDPMISRFGLRGVAVRAPFPLTVDLNLFQYAACSVGELAWTPYADLRNGSCSKRMLDLMNTFPPQAGILRLQGVPVRVDQPNAASGPRTACRHALRLGAVHGAGAVPRLPRLLRAAAAGNPGTLHGRHRLAGPVRPAVSVGERSACRTLRHVGVFRRTVVRWQNELNGRQRHGTLI